VKTRRAFFWSAIGQVFSFAFNFAGTVVVARLLSPLEMGIFVIGAATIGLISGLTSLGVGSYVVREPELTDEILDTAFTLNAILALGLASLVALVGQVSEWVLGSAQAGNVLMVLAITPALGIFTFRPATLMQRNMEFKTIALISTSAALIGTAVTIASAFAGASYMAPAWGSLTMAVVSLVGYLITGSRYIGFSVGLANWREITTFGLRMVTITGAATISNRLADIGLGRLQSLQALGLYSRASTLSSQIFDNVYGTATRVVFVHLSEENRRTGEIGESFLRSFRMITAFMWPLLFGLAMLSPVVIHTIYGEKWIAAAGPLSIILIAQVITLGFGMNWELFVIRNETALQTKIELYRNVIGLSVFLVGCTFSLTLAAVGKVCDALIGLALYRRHVLRLSGLSQPQINRAYCEGGLLSFAAVLPSGVLMACERWSENTSLAIVAGAVALGVAMWAACLLWLRHPLIDELAVLRRAALRLLSEKTAGSRNVA
jgi:O-antigen/teichoic acid export membrane protein